MKGDYIIIDSGYAGSKQEYEQIKSKWKAKNSDLKVVRERTDTKGLIMYTVRQEDRTRRLP